LKELGDERVDGGWVGEEREVKQKRVAKACVRQ
jgi:hypothetical protein